MNIQSKYTTKMTDSPNKNFENVVLSFFSETTEETNAIIGIENSKNGIKVEIVEESVPAVDR